MVVEGGAVVEVDVDVDAVASAAGRVLDGASELPPEHAASTATAAHAPAIRPLRASRCIVERYGSGGPGHGTDVQVRRVAGGTG